MTDLTKAAAMSKNNKTNIDLQDVCLHIEGNLVLKHLSLQREFKRLAIIGRNGSGKSTLSRALAGLIDISTGHLQVGGINPFKDRHAALLSIGILFQNPDHQIIFPTVLEEMMFGLRQLGQSKTTAKQNALDTLKSFAKVHWQDIHTTALSQGQKHLVCLMAVVAMQPKLIILDEPFAGLDIPTKRQLKRYLDKFSGCLIHISHDPSDVQDYDQLLWLEAGSIAASGSAQQVLPRYLEAMNRMGEGDDISELPG